MQSVRGKDLDQFWASLRDLTSAIIENELHRVDLDDNDDEEVDEALSVLQAVAAIAMNFLVSPRAHTRPRPRPRMPLPGARGYSAVPAAMQMDESRQAPEPMLEAMELMHGILFDLTISPASAALQVRLPCGGFAHGPRADYPRAPPLLLLSRERGMADGHCAHVRGHVEAAAAGARASGGADDTVPRGEGAG